MSDQMVEVGPPPIDRRKNLEASFSAKAIAQGGEVYTGYINGWGIQGFDAFQGTPFEIYIPIMRRVENPEVTEELSTLTSEQLSTEPFQEFFRHVDMCLSFNRQGILENNLATIIGRSRTEGHAFAQAVYPDYPESQEGLEDAIMLRMVAALDPVLKDGNKLIPSDGVLELAEYANGSYPELFSYAIAFDKRNEAYGKPSLNLEAHVLNELLPSLLDPSRKDDPDLLRFFGTRYTTPGFHRHFAHKALAAAETPEQIAHISDVFIPVIGGIAEFRVALRKIVHDDPSFRPKFEAVMDYLKIDKDKSQEDLVRDVYNQIEFENYYPNAEAQATDAVVLQKFLEGKKEVLDLACGTGRHIDIAKSIEGVHVTGIDLVPRHVEYAKKKHPDTNLIVGTWFNLPFADRKFDAIYMLGRSFTHNLTPRMMAECLEEAGAVLKDDGKILLDIPVQNQGDYKQFVEEMGAKLADLGLTNHQKGFIHDSPDLVHYFDRYVPDEHAFVAICLLAGFIPQELPEKYTYIGQNGEENTNTYWVLQKTGGTKVVYGGKRALHAEIQGIR